jgi:hypothetical protein
MQLGDSTSAGATKPLAGRAAPSPTAPTPVDMGERKFLLERQKALQNELADSIKNLGVKRMRRIFKLMREHQQDPNRELLFVPLYGATLGEFATFKVVKANK